MTLRHTQAFLYALCLILSFQTAEAQSRFFGSGQITSSLITSSIQDSRGFIWTGTEYGLNRFDGINMTEYYKGDEEGSLLDNSIRDLYCDREGNVWIGMITGMQKYDHMSDSFQTVRIEGTAYYTPNVSHIIQLESGKIWIIASRLGIFEIDPTTMTAKRLESIREMCGTNHFNNFHEDKHQRVWIGTDEDGIFCLDKTHKHVTQYRLTERSAEHIDRIGETANGVIVTACEGRIWMFDEVRHNFVPLKQPEATYLNTKAMLLRNNGDFLIASAEHGLWKINEMTQSIEKEDFPFQADVNQEKAHITCLMEDKEENLWCGYFQRGLVMIPPPTTQEDYFNFWNLSTFEESNRHTDYGATSAICRDEEGYIWCSTQDGTLFMIDSSGKPVRKYNLGTMATCIFEDSRRELWIGTENFGMNRLDRKSGMLRQIPELSEHHICSIVEQNGDLLYIGTLGDGIWKYDMNTGECRKFITDDPQNYRLLRNSYINKLMIDSQNRLWICHYLGAACLDLKSGRYLDIATDRTLNYSVGYALTESSDGSVWIGTNNGIFVWNDENRNYMRYTAKNGLSSNMICGLAEDSEGNIWCSTFRGINRITPSSREVAGFNTNNGTARQEFIQGVYCNDGENIYFGDSYGVTSFAPPINTIATERAIYLTDMYLGNQKSNPARYMKDERSLSIPYAQNTVTFRFSTMAIRGAENIRFRYRLTGLDGEWYTTAYGFNTMTYNHLPSGRYTLEICAEENSVLSPVQKWTIRIGRPWYRSMTANILYMLVISAGIALAYIGIRRQRREEANEKKLRYYVNMAHEIRSPMVMIMNPIEKLLKNEDDAEKRHVLNTMKRNSTRVVRLMNHFLDLKKIDKGQMILQCREVNLVEVLKETLDTFAYEANKRNISIDFDYQLDRMIFNVDPDHIDTIIFNLVTNALKYTPDGGEIKVCLGMSDIYGNIMISVSDTGPGIAEKDIQRIYTRF